jgi:hypothetical protein
MLRTVFQVANNGKPSTRHEQVLEQYVTIPVMQIITSFFSSPFSDSSTSNVSLTPFPLPFFEATLRYSDQIKSVADIYCVVILADNGTGPLAL